MKRYAFSVIILALVSGNLLAQTAAPTPRELVAKLGVLNGKATSLPKPVYPQAAVKSKASGAVTVNVTVDEKGDVTSATSDFENVLLRDAAIGAAKQAKFQPYMFQGKARKVVGTLVYNFTGPTEEEPLDLSVIQELADNDPRFATLFAAGDIPGQVETGKYGEAIDTLDIMIAKNPKDEWALGYRAMARLRMFDLEGALADANAALAVKADNTSALNVRALIEQQKSQSELAKKDFDHAIAISTTAIAKSPGSMDSYFARAETYRFSGDNAKAAADYRKTLQLTPKYAFAQEHLDIVTGKTPPVPQNVAKFKVHFDEFTRLDKLFDAADERARSLENGIKADNRKNGRDPFTKPANNTAICSALAEMDRLYARIFDESLMMTEMKDAGELKDRPDFIKFADQVEDDMGDRGGDILLRQGFWGCKK